MADPFSAWGAEESGARLAEKDQIFARQRALEAQRMMGEIAMQPDEARMKRSHADLYEAQAGKFKRENAADERFQAAVAGTTLPDDPMEKLYSIMDLSLKSGNVTTAAKMADEIGKLGLRGAQAERAQAAAATAQVNAAVKKQDFIANRLSAATSQGEWNQINQQYESEFQEASPYRGMPFTPQLAKSVGQQAVTAKDRLKLEMDRIEEKGRQYGRSIQDRAQKAQEAIGIERNRIAELRAKAIKKAGGSAGTPSLRELEITSGLLKDHLPELKSDDKTRAAQDIASRAKEIRAENRSIGASEAIQRAFKEFNELGVFDTNPGYEVPLFGGTVGRSVKYSSGGMSRETAIPMPREKKDMKKGRYYTTPRGLARWNGEAFDPAADDEEDDE